MPLNFSFSNLYSKGKQLMSDVYGGVKTGVNALKQGKDYLHEQMNKLSSIPFVGDMLAAEADKLTETPFIFGASLNDVGRFIDTASSYVNSPHITEFANRADAVLSPALQGLDSAIGARSG